MNYFRSDLFFQDRSDWWLKTVSHFKWFKLMNILVFSLSDSGLVFEISGPIRGWNEERLGVGIKIWGKNGNKVRTLLASKTEPAIIGGIR
jgi:hypothetical protein